MVPMVTCLYTRSGTRSGARARSLDSLGGGQRAEEGCAPKLIRHDLHRSNATGLELLVLAPI